MKFLITGGLGFIGTNLIKFLLSKNEHEILNLDKITYSANSSENKFFKLNDLYSFVKGDICDETLVTGLLNDFKPDFVMNLAAESHVDKSISGPNDFIRTNIFGTTNLLNTTKDYWSKLSGKKKYQFRFHHISTDEVFGSVFDDGLFHEESRYDPSSPYAASKASSDHLVRAWHKTYGLPILISNCSNNYGPYQYPEKLIPLIILNALELKSLPIYGNGLQVRDWLHVEDHVKALYKIITNGTVGETYNIGANNQINNIKLVKNICNFLDSELKEKQKGIQSYKDLIRYVDDRPGHDVCYGIDARKIKKELDWNPEIDFQLGIQKTIRWYINNKFLYITKK